MVFYYEIRGGQCRGNHSHITLDGKRDVTCYVGRDKHENEFLIKYGWPGDVSFFFFLIRNIITQMKYFSHSYHLFSLLTFAISDS